MRNYFIIWICSIWGVISVFCLGGNNMAWQYTLIIAVAPAIITAAVTIIGMKKSQMNKINDTVSELSKRIGGNNECTLSENISSKFDKIDRDIGRGENSSLTVQHKDMSELINKEIDIVEKRYKEEEQRIRNYTLEQHKIAENIEQFQLLMNSWKRLAEDCVNYQRSIDKFKERENTYKDEISSLEKRVKEQSEKYDELTKKYNNLVNIHNADNTLNKTNFPKI